ncbi:MAG: HAMP domain-containing histidine kinase [Deltaproteobacteria bacterium]|nr:HAMP domain-containing histidine kinase [Deltaproteobacteria bacterium]
MREAAAGRIAFAGWRSWWKTGAAAAGWVAAALGLGYGLQSAGAGDELLLVILVLMVIGPPLFFTLPLSGPTAAAFAAGLGWWCAGGVLAGALLPVAGLGAAALASAAMAVRQGSVRRLRERIGELQRGAEALAAANAAQQQGSEVAEAILTATRDISASLDAGELAVRVARNAYALTNGAAAAVLLWDAAREALRVAATAGGGGSSEAHQLEVNLRNAEQLQGALREGMADIPRVALRDPVLDALLRRWKAGAVLAARLQRGGRPLGLVLVARRGCEPASPKACQILSGIALQAAAALEIANLVNDLRTAGSLREEFTATMSHELRTPLNVIIGYTEMQREGMFGDLSPDHLDTLARVHEQALQLLDLIQATLDVGRLERGLMTVELREVSVPEVLAQVFGAIPPSWRKSGVELQWRIDPAVPQIRSDASKLQVVLRNLVHNALKFTDAGQVLVTATTDPDRQWVHFVVQDSGRGIAAQDLTVIFEMFRQSSERDPALGGVGLGLYIVKRLIGLLGGEIDVRSAPGRGATFRIHIPAAGPHAGAKPRGPRSAGTNRGLSSPASARA